MNTQKALAHLKTVFLMQGLTLAIQQVISKVLISVLIFMQ